jgi:SAM-dependent methyltransferase
VAPLVIDLVAPRSVVDVGCGEGGWAAAFRDGGVEDVWGVDGDYVDRSKLRIASERFLARNLEEPLRLDRTFDLVVSLEVGEHLPERCARPFVGSLTELAPVILFSAAICGQGGTHHVNEQWPEYWAALFAERGYLCFDAIRRGIWDDREVAWWYRQNTFLYVRESELAKYPRIAAIAPDGALPMRVVHPELLDLKVSQMAELEALVPQRSPSRVRRLLRRLRGVSGGRRGS